MLRRICFVWSTQGGDGHRGGRMAAVHDHCYSGGFIHFAE
jgi:hypothetical protein